MIIRAELKCKQTGCEADPCAVDKVIELPSPRFKQFSRALLADYDFIAENKDAIQRDEDVRHCLLILDADGKDGFLVDPQGHNYARYSAFVPNARSLLTPDMAIDRSYLSPAEPWRDESRDEMLRMTLRVNGKPDYTLVLPADEEYLDAVKAYLDIDVFADAMLCDIRFKVPYIGELIRDTDCPAVEDYNDFAEALEDIWQQDGALLTYAAALEAEHVNVPCEINVLVTDDAGIRAINRAMRNIDRETDVLSFPMFQFTPGQFPEDVQEDIDPQTGLLPLGDMAISLERARDQAKRFGNSLRRETGYLTIHSILHLLGYDHMDEGEMKRQMRTREEIIAGQLGLQR